MFVGTIADVYAGVETVVAVETGVAVCHHASRHRQSANDDVVFKEQTGVCAVAATRVFAVRPTDVNPFVLRQLVAIGCAHNVFAAYVGTHRGGTEEPAQVGGHAAAIHIGAVIVFACCRTFLASDELVVVVVAVPVELWHQRQPVGVERLYCA